MIILKTIRFLAFASLTTFLLAGCATKEKEKGKVDWSEVNQAFNEGNHEKNILACHDKLKKIKPKAKGQIQVSYSYYGNAKDIKLEDISPDLQNAAFKKCILAAAKKVNLKKIKEKSEKAGYEATLNVNRIYVFQ